MFAVPARSAVTLPIEVVGEAGAEATVLVDIPAGQAIQVRGLWMQIHGLGFADMASVRVNQNPWVPLNNATVQIAEPGRSYGGIGGGFATLKMTLPLAPASVSDGVNTIQFRFNRTDGVASGFRVLAFQFKTADGKSILPPDEFQENDPNSWTPTLPDADSIASGRNLWYDGKLVANGLPGAAPIRAHCSDCHAQDGRDLKYFNFSNASIAARSRFHGLSELQGRQVASYIRSLKSPNPGRPWNPPYQPGPGLDAQPVANWAAGAGLQWVLDRDTDSLPYLFPAVTPAAFRPDGNLNPREIPIAMQLPDWNHWLPRIHPLDGWGKAPPKSLPPHPPLNSNKWTAGLAEKLYSTQLLQLVKTWESVQEGGEETEARIWPNTVPAATAPSEANIPNGPAGMGGSALTNEYFSSAWYQLQVVVNGGNHRHHGRTPIDWPYLAAHFLDLERLSGRAEPARLLVTLIKAIQSTDPAFGPANYAEGWRPDRNIDPRIMVSEEWAPEFAPLAAPMKTAIIESFLSAWLDKTLQYSPESYFSRGIVPTPYVWPQSLRDVAGGTVWQSALQFEAAGVNPQLIERIRTWGKTYSEMAELFHY